MTVIVRGGLLQALFLVGPSRKPVQVHVENATASTTWEFRKNRSYFIMLPVRYDQGALLNVENDFPLRDYTGGETLCAAVDLPPPKQPQVDLPPPAPQVVGEEVQEVEQGGAVEEQAEVPEEEAAAAVPEGGADKVQPEQPQDDEPVPAAAVALVEPEPEKPMAVVAPLQEVQQQQQVEAKKPPRPKIPRRLLEEFNQEHNEQEVSDAMEEEEDEGIGGSDDMNTSGISPIKFEESSQEEDKLPEEEEEEELKRKNPTEDS